MFLVANMAEPLLAESDQARVEPAPEILPPISPDHSPLPIPINPGINFNSYDSDNMFPVDIIPGDSIPPNIVSLDTKTAQEPTNNKAESSIEQATVDVDPDHSPPSCNSDISTTGKKLRREQGEQCAPPGRYLPFTGESPSKKDTDQSPQPEPKITEEEIKRIFKDDQTWLKNDVPSPFDPYWRNPEATPCINTPGRPISACCLGPPRTRRRFSMSFIDMENCQVYIAARPLCMDPLIAAVAQFCCGKIDFTVQTVMGFLGRDCVQMGRQLRWEFDGFSPFEGGGTLP